jgi:hypothetical protein
MKRLGSKILGAILGILVVLAVRYVGDFIDTLGMDKKIDALAGVWYCMEDGQDQVADLMDLADFYEEEVAAIGEVSLEFVKIAEFRQDRTYRFSYDAQKSKANVRAMYETAVKNLYENRASLTALYGEEILDYSWEEFAQAYAEMYTMESMDALLDAFADNAYDYDKLGEDFETGTYTIKGDDIMCTITGEYVEEALGYKIDGQNLTLTYTNLVEYYTRAN